MATRFRIYWVIALVLFSMASSGSTASAPAPVESRSVYLAAGVGIEGIAVGYSTKSSVTAKYGNDFELITHKVYSYEMRYSDLGLSFWYRYSDPEQKIFCISVRPPCNGFTSRGIVVGSSKLKDVFKAYGETELSTSTGWDWWYAEYPGIEFLIDYKQGDSLNDENKKYLNRKIVEIDIVQIGSEPKLGNEK